MPAKSNEINTILSRGTLQFLTEKNNVGYKCFYTMIDSSNSDGDINVLINSILKEKLTMKK
jgi:hypothetical protein